MRPILIKTILESLLKEFNEGACDNMSIEETDLLLNELALLKDKLEDKLDKVLTIEEVSLYLHCTRQTVNNYVKQGLLHPKKHLGGSLEFKFKEVKSLLK